MAALNPGGINTIIGSGSSFIGDLNLNGYVRIDGDVKGNVTTDGSIFIGPAARINGDVKALAANIGGIVLGNVEAPEAVHLYETAAVIGDVTTKHLEVAEGVILHGHCIALKDDAAFRATVQDWQDAKAIRSRAGY